MFLLLLNLLFSLDKTESCVLSFIFVILFSCYYYNNNNNVIILNPLFAEGQDTETQARSR